MSAEMIDLKPFCSTERYRVAIHEPFSRGEWTYATNGYIMVRVPRRADVPEVEKAPAAERVWPEQIAGRFLALKAAKLPAPEFVRCDICEGRGTKHKCPDCTCACDECDGEGTLEVHILVQIGQAHINAKYLRKMLELPGLTIEAVPPSAAAIQFRFDGGEGLVMPVKRIREDRACVRVEFADDA